MAVAFNEVPNTNRVPQTFYEPDGSRALSLQAGEPHRVLLVGIMAATGTATPLVAAPIFGEEEGDSLYGPRSQLASMARAFKRVNRTARVEAIGVAENGAGTAATSTFTITGTATKDGSLRVRIGDKRVSLGVASGTALAAVATALAAVINATERVPVTAAAAAGVVTLTSVHKGELGNAVTLEVEIGVDGLTITPAQPANGATNPDLAALIAALPEERYDTIVTGLTDAANVGLLEVELMRRYGPVVKQPGHLIGAIRATSAGALTTYGDARNSRVSTIVGDPSPTAPWVVAAQVAARDAQQCDALPNLPRNGLVLPDVEAPKLEDRFDATTRNLLLYDGISTLKYDRSGKVMIERLITTYQTNASGLTDATYLSIEVVRNLAGIYLEALDIGARYDRVLVAPDGTNVSAGVPIVTPASLRGVLVAWNDSLIRRGRAKDAEGFAEALLVEINETDGERIDVQLSSRLVRGLVTLAIKNAFQL